MRRFRNDLISKYAGVTLKNQLTWLLLAYTNIKRLPKVTKITYISAWWTIIITSCFERYECHLLLFVCLFVFCLFACLYLFIWVFVICLEFNSRSCRILKKTITAFITLPFQSKGTLQCRRQCVGSVLMERHLILL